MKYNILLDSSSTWITIIIWNAVSSWTTITLLNTSSLWTTIILLYTVSLRTWLMFLILLIIMRRFKWEEQKKDVWSVKKKIQHQEKKNHCSF